MKGERIIWSKRGWVLSASSLSVPLVAVVGSVGR